MKTLTNITIGLGSVLFYLLLQLLATEIGVVSTQITKADKAEHIKRKRHTVSHTIHLGKYRRSWESLDKVLKFMSWHYDMTCKNHTLCLMLRVWRRVFIKYIYNQWQKPFLIKHTYFFLYRFGGQTPYRGPGLSGLKGWRRGS